MKDLKSKRVDAFSEAKKTTPDVRQHFTDLLKSKGWDFEQFPNPYCCYAIKK